MYTKSFPFACVNESDQIYPKLSNCTLKFGSQNHPNVNLTQSSAVSSVMKPCLLCLWVWKSSGVGREKDQQRACLGHA